jgi:hypothetical protein
MITIHHLGVSQSDRIVWLMEELDLPYRLKWHKRTEAGLAPNECITEAYPPQYPRAGSTTFSSASPASKRSI